MLINKSIWSGAVLNENSIIEEAIMNLEASGLKIALIVNSNQQLVGIVTDGDIRRGFIRGSGLGSSVFDIMNSTPATVNEKVSPQQIAFMMKERKVQHIPVVGESMKLIGLHVEGPEVEHKSRTNRVVIMAGDSNWCVRSGQHFNLSVNRKPITFNFLIGIPKLWG